MDDLTNRIMAVAFAFLFIFGILIILLLVWSSPEESITRLRDLADYLEDHNNTEAQLIITFGGIILILLAVLLILFELVPTEGNSLRIQQIGSGEVEIGSDEVGRRIEETLLGLPQIEHVEAKVLGRGKKAEIHLSLHVTPDANLAAAAEAACQRTTELVEGQMSVALAKPPSAQVHYRELRVGEAASGTPAFERPSEPAAPSQPETTETESTDATREGPATGA